MEDRDIPHVVVVGGGFAGLNVVRGLRRAPVRVTLVDRANHHCFQPLLYQVATGGLSPGEIAPPLRWVLRRQDNVEVVLAEVEQIDVGARELHGRGVDGVPVRLAWDELVLATGAGQGYFGNDHWATHAPGLKSIDDALDLRRRIYGAFERADAATRASDRARALTFVVVGAGPTGVELAGQLVEIARRTLRREYRSFDVGDAHVVLVDAAPVVLGAFDARLGERARRQLEEIGVEVRTGAMVTGVDEHGVDLAVRAPGDAPEDEPSPARIDAGTIVWAAGVQGSPLGAQLAGQLGAEVDRAGRVVVNDDFTVGGDAHVRLIGDLAATGLPGVAPVAMQQGEWVARSIAAATTGARAPRPFAYRDRGSMATIGRRRAVAHIGRLRLSGTIAWLAWLVVHLMFLVGFANKLLVLVRWAWGYVVFGRGERALSIASRDRDGGTA